MANKLTAKDVSQLNKVMNAAIKNRAMHKGLAANPAATVDRFRDKIGFDSSGLSKQAIDLLGSVTEEELGALSSIYQKAIAAGAPDASLAIAF